MSSNSTQRLPIGTIVIAVFFLLVMLGTYLLVKPPAPPSELQGVISSPFKHINDFKLVTVNDKALTQADFKDKWSFIFFGYTSCPDVCPATLHVLSQVMQLLKDDGVKQSNEIQVLFVSVDPNRDTPKKITEYVSYFDKSFIAATGDIPSLNIFSGQLGASYIIEEETAPGNYHISHTSAIFLVDPLVRRVATFSQPHYAITIHKQFKKIREYFLS